MNIQCRTCRTCHSFVVKKINNLRVVYTRWTNAFWFGRLRSKSVSILRLIKVLEHYSIVCAVPEVTDWLMTFFIFLYRTISYAAYCLFWCTSAEMANKHVHFSRHTPHTFIRTPQSAMCITMQSRLVFATDTKLTYRMVVFWKAATVVRTSYSYARIVLCWRFAPFADAMSACWALLTS